MSTEVTSTRLGALWEAVDSLLAHATTPGILTHKLGPLAANRLRRLGEPVPERLVKEERAAALSMLTATPLIERVRASFDGPMVLIKGPEMAHLYPARARRFADIDLLTDDAGGVQRALIASGFVEVEDPDVDALPEHHHLRPLQWPTIELVVEVHTSPNWPLGMRQPPIGEILDASVPSGLGIAGVSTPAPLHHALILASHGWRHEPLKTLRDLIDVAAVSAHSDARELDRTAATWGIGRLWQTTSLTAEALFYGGRETFPLRSWARHLDRVRGRTVFERHLMRLLYAYWGMPPQKAAMQTLRVVEKNVRRASHAVYNLTAPVVRHGPQPPPDGRCEPPDS